MSRIKSKKYAGVYLNHLENGDVSYSIIYKDGNKTKRFTVGKKSAGITETFSYNKRNEFINKLKLGIDPIAHKKKKKITTLNNLAQIYFDDKSSENKANKKQSGRYNLHIKEMLGDRNILGITKDDVKKLQKNLLGKKKAPKTINGIITLLKAIINYSIKEKELNIVNPVVGIKNRFLLKKCG